VYATHALDVATMDWNGNGLPDAILGSYGDLGPVLLQDWNGAGFDSATVEPHGSEAFDVAAVDTGRNGFPAPVALLPSVGLVAIDHTVPAARAEPYGAGCPGTFGVTPRMSTSRLPNLGNGEFVISVLDAYPNVPALLFLSFRRAQTPLPGPPGCDVLVSLDLPWFVIWSGFGALAPGVGPNGAAHVTFHIPGPAQAALFQGLDVYAQWAVLDPGGSVPTSPPLSLSEGLRMIIY
jgi:hypothetical protein